MPSKNPPIWIRIIESIVWYLWLALGPTLKRYLLDLDARAEDHVHEDGSNKLHNKE